MVSLAGIAGLISLGVSVGDCNYFITGDELIAAVRAAHEDRVRQEGKAI